MLNYLQIAWLTITFLIIAAVYIQYFYAPKPYDGFSNHHSFLITEMIGNIAYKSIFLDKSNLPSFMKWLHQLELATFAI